MAFTLRFRSLTRSFSRFNLISSRFCSAAGTRPRGAESRLRPGLAYLVLILAVLLLSASASAQVTYTGTAATQNFGSQAVGSASAAVTLNFSVAAGTTVGSIGVLTQGAPNLDFNSATGGTCAAQVYTTAATCTVNVTFKPEFSGTRYGAVVFSDNSGNVLATVYLQGSGMGPQVNFSPGMLISLGGGLRSPDADGAEGLAVDGSGDVFVADSGNSAVKKIPPGCASSACVTTLGGGFANPLGVAVDSGGNIFVADSGNSAVKEMPSGCASSACVTTLGGAFSGPWGVAVDGIGNVFVSEYWNNDVKEIPAGCTSAACVTKLGGGFDQLRGIAVDGSGNVIVADSNNNDVKEIPAGCTSAACVTVLVGYIFLPEDVAVDGSGNIFVASDSVYEIMAAGGYTTVKNLAPTPFSLLGPDGVAVDGSGNVYVTINPEDAIKKLDLADPPSLTFANTGVGVESSDSPQTVKLSNDGNATLVLSALAYPPDFPEASGDANACTGSTSLGAGQACDLPIEFNPQQAGAVNESVTPTDNALNVTGAQQAVAVSGTGYVLVEGASQFSVTLTSLTSVFGGLPFSITVTALNLAGSAAATYNGTVSFTSSDPGFVNPGPLTLSNGVGQATVTLQTLGAQSITATDTTTASVAGSGNFNVIPPPPVAFYPTSASVNLGSQAVGSAGAANTLNFSIAAGTTVGSIAVLTQGAPNLDFTDASGGTCAAQVYASAATCTVNVKFKPGHPGLRMGAVVFFSETGYTGTSLGQLPIYGIGTGPQATFANTTSGIYLPSSQSTLGSGFNYPYGAAVDASGNVFVADYLNNAVKEIMAAGGYTTAKTLGSGFNGPTGVAVDGSGNVFVADYLNNAVKEIVGAGGYTTIKTLGSGFFLPTSVAVDGSGNVYVTDKGDYAVKEIVAGDGYTTVNTLGLDWGFSRLVGVAVDGSGNVFVADWGRGAVYEFVAASGYITLNTLGSAFRFPNGVAVDGAGNVFVTDGLNNAVKEIVAAGGYTTVNTLGSGLSYPYGVAVDGSGNVYVTDDGNNLVVKLDYADPPVLGFLPSNTASATRQTVMVMNDGNAGLTFPLPASGNNPSITASFSLDSSGPFACPLLNSASSTPGTLAADASCALSIEFTPTTISPTATGTLTLTDNALNASSPTYAAQTIQLNGTAGGPPFGELDKAEDTVTFSTTVGQSDSVEIKGWVADQVDGAPMSNVKVYIDGTSIGTPTLGIANPGVAALRDNDTYLHSGYQMLYSASSLSLGAHDVTVIAIDSGGRSTTFGPVTFTVAATAGAGSPFGELGPAVDSVTSSTTISQSDSVKISGWIFDPGNGVAMSSVTAYIDGTSIGTPTLGIARGGVAKDYGSSYLNSGYQMLYPASSLSLGAHSVTVIAVDSGGRSTTFGPVSFTVQ